MKASRMKMKDRNHRISKEECWNSKQLLVSHTCLKPIHNISPFERVELYSDCKSKNSMSTTTIDAQSSLSAQRLLGKVALVTGGASGIGKSIVHLFHIHGAKICIADVQDNLGKQVCESLGGNTNVCFFHCDVTVKDDVQSAVDFIVSKFGTLDIVVHNARISGSPCLDIRNANLPEFDKVFNINVKGV